MEKLWRIWQMIMKICQSFSHLIFSSECTYVVIKVLMDIMLIIFKDATLTFHECYPFKYKRLLVRINHEAIQAKHMATYSYAPGETSNSYYLHMMSKELPHFDL